MSATGSTNVRRATGMLWALLSEKDAGRARGSRRRILALLDCFERGADPGAFDDVGRAPIHLMARECGDGDLRPLTAALRPGLLDLPDREALTPLLWAAREDCLPAAFEHLVAAGAGCDAKDRDGATPLLRLCDILYGQARRGCGDPTLAKMSVLLAAGASPRARDHYGADCWQYLGRRRARAPEPEGLDADQLAGRESYHREAGRILLAAGAHPEGEVCGYEVTGGKIALDEFDAALASQGLPRIHRPHPATGVPPAVFLTDLECDAAWSTGGITPANMHPFADV